MKISEIVATQRRRLGMKQYQLAERTGIAPSQISIFERGGSGMVTTNLEKVLVALGLHIVFDKQPEQERLARELAHILIQRKVQDVRSLVREEAAALLENDDILLLPMVSEELYRRYTRSKVIDETNTWNYFLKLTQEYYLEEMDAIYEAERKAKRAE